MALFSFIRKDGVQYTRIIDVSYSNFSPALLASHDWHMRLSAILSANASISSTLGLVEEIAHQLRIDSTLLFRFPKDEGPHLLYGKYNSKSRFNDIQDYLNGHYILDPFYSNLQICREVGLLPLRDLIEEGFDKSEYYKVYYQSVGLADEMCFCCGDGQSGYILLALGRNVGKGCFTKEELSTSKNIAPLIQGALRTTWHTLEQPDLSSVKRPPTDDMHRHLQNARINFGKSVLTRREFEVMQLLLKGNSVCLISKKLAISIGTVKVHRKHIYAKLNIGSLSEIFALFLDVVSATCFSPNMDPLENYKMRA